MTNRFTLEEKIMDCWQVVNDLDLLFSRTCEEQMEMNDVVNLALGLKTLYQHRFDDLFSTFETLCKDGAFTTEPIADDCTEAWIPPFLRAGGTD